MEWSVEFNQLGLDYEFKDLTTIPLDQYLSDFEAILGLLSALFVVPQGYLMKGILNSSSLVSYVGGFFADYGANLLSLATLAGEIVWQSSMFLLSFLEYGSRVAFLATWDFLQFTSFSFQNVKPLILDTISWIKPKAQ
mmetsp:Transcript_10211/g.15544  ORF Transcript_10211/g.15544 Transcript_10211/m.15544 type:complete len:138 (-) Transcript_10211:509-922(-)